MVMPVAKCTISENIMTMTDETLPLDINVGGSLFIDSDSYICIDYDKVKRED